MYRTVSATYSVIAYCQWERRVVDTLQFIPRRNVPSRDLTCPLIMQDWKITDRIGHDFHHFQLGHFSQVKQKNSAIADKPRDAFRGQSRSPNMVPFRMIGMVSYWCPIVTLSLFDFKNAVTLKTCLWVRQGHRKCHHSRERI